MSTIQRRSERRAFPVLARRLAAFGAAAIGSLGTARSAGAQGGTDERVLLGNLFSQVERGSPKIAAARSLAQAAEARVSGARRPPDPQLQFGFMNYTLPGLAQMPIVGMAQVQAMQMLPLGGKLSLAGRAAAARASATSERARDASWMVRNEAAMAFYDLYATDRSLDVARETIRLLQDIEKTAQSMYRVGAGQQTDVLRAQVEIARMAEDTIRMRSMRQTMTAKLNALLNQDTDSQFGAPALPRFPDSLPSRAWLDSIAYSNRPMVRAGIDEVHSAGAAENLARKDIWPDLQIGVQYAQRGGEMGTERMGSLMLGASIPVFARDRQVRMREEASAMRQMAEADLAAMRAETRGKIGEAYANLRRAQNLAQLYRSTVLPQAEATVASALSAYRVGQVTFMTLLDDRMTVNKYRTELYGLDADQGKAWAEIEMLIGHELFDPNQITPANTADTTPHGRNDK